jgi:hypothetical protein
MYRDRPKMINPRLIAVYNPKIGYLNKRYTYTRMKGRRINPIPAIKPIFAIRKLKNAAIPKISRAKIGLPNLLEPDTASNGFN